MTKKLILFDCDGTLVDSEYLNNLAVLETLAQFGVNNYDMDYALEHFVGLRFSNIIEMVKSETDAFFPKDANLFYLQKARDLASAHMRPIDGAEKVIQTAEKHAKIGVVSNGERNNVLMSLDFVGLKKYFAEEDIFTGLMAKPKPAPDLYELAANTMGFKNSEILIIEDSVTGVKSGTAANMTVWGFTGTHHDPEKHIKTLKSHGAEKVFNTMSEIQSALAEHFSLHFPP